MSVGKNRIRDRSNGETGARGRTYRKRYVFAMGNLLMISKNSVSVIFVGHSRSAKTVQDRLHESTNPKSVSWHIVELV